MTSKAFLPKLALVAMLLSPISLFAADASWTRDDAAHLLRRAGFGGTPEQIDALYAMGKTGAVDYMLTGQLPANVTTPPFAHVDLPVFHHEPAPPPTTQDIKVRIMAKNKERFLEVQELRDWWLDRMMRTDRPLEEKMTVFWHGLFCSGIKEVKDADAMARQNALFHQMALGNYYKLTRGIINDSAMLRYLNADENVKGKPNENLARELMELFTMGEGQGYTEQDIGQVARALTGLTAGRYGSIMRMRNHDDGEKTIFGKTGNFGPEDVVNLIFARPEPSKYLAKKLWEFYAYPDPSDADLAPVIEALRASNYEVKPALRTIFLSDAFYGGKAKFSLITSPTELIVQAVRELGTNTEPANLAPIIRQMQTMGQELLEPPNVKGWPGGEHWITSSSLFTRYNTACALVNGNFAFAGRFAKKNGRVVASMPQPRQLFPNLPATCKPEQVVDASIARFLQRPLNAEKRDVLIKSLGPAPLTLGEASSDQRVREMLCLLLSTPEFQVH